MLFPFGETVTRLRATAVTDPYSGAQTAKSWTDPDRLDIPGCGIDPGGSTEPVEAGRTAVITTPTVYAPPGVDVRAGDRLQVRGRTYAVDGRPAEWASPFTGWQPGTVINLKEVAG